MEDCNAFWCYTVKLNCSNRFNKYFTQWKYLCVLAEKTAMENWICMLNQSCQVFFTKKGIKLLKILKCKSCVYKLKLMITCFSNLKYINSMQKSGMAKKR